MLIGRYGTWLIHNSDAVAKATPIDLVKPCPTNNGATCSAAQCGSMPRAAATGAVSRQIRLLYSAYLLSIYAKL